GGGRGGVGVRGASRGTGGANRTPSEAGGATMCGVRKSVYSGGDPRRSPCWLRAYTAIILAVWYEFPGDWRSTFAAWRPRTQQAASLRGRGRCLLHPYGVVGAACCVLRSTRSSAIGLMEGAARPPAARGARPDRRGGAARGCPPP